MSMPLVLQRLEGVMPFVVATLVYFNQGFSWVGYVFLYDEHSGAITADAAQAPPQIVNDILGSSHE